jgi:cysteine desulfurase
MSLRSVYLDYSATTPLDPLVQEAMEPYLKQDFGNPSSVHQWGQTVRRAIDAARDTVAENIGCHPSEIYFTSGGTEANNTALLGVLLKARERGRDHLITTAIEHHAVLDCARFAEGVLGFRVTYLPVDRYGQVSPEAIVEAITDKTALVSVMHANNEIGTIQDVTQMARIAREKGVYFHCDAVQTWGQLPLNVDDLGVDLLTLSAHKIYGPKGVGALYVRKGVPFLPWLHGGQQEREKRAGTENVSGIIGMGKAVELLPTWRGTEAERWVGLRDSFIADLCQAIPGLHLNGHPAKRLPNNINVSFPKTDGETLLLHLDLHGIAASSGSACASGSIEPSHVLLALGLPLTLAQSAVRFSLGRQTTVEDIHYTFNVLTDFAK